MRRLPTTLAAAACLLAGCVGDPPASVADAGADAAAPADVDAAPPPDGLPASACAVFGAPGDCVATADCAALGDHTSYAGYCPGPADIQCCIETPNVADNPPIPDGWRYMTDAEVTPPMTEWAVAILHDPVTYPMFSTTTMLFGDLEVMARVEWHPPDFQNGAVHRGVSLFLRP